MVGLTQPKLLPLPRFGAQVPEARFEIVGHRGLRSLADPSVIPPENTIPAFIAAFRAGVDAVELDVQATKDGVLVVCHDGRLTSIYRLPGGVRQRRIVDMTYAELQKTVLNETSIADQVNTFLWRGKKPGKRYIVPEQFRHEKLPTLAEVVDAVDEDYRKNPQFYRKPPYFYMEMKTNSWLDHIQINPKRKLGYFAKRTRDWFDKFYAMHNNGEKLLAKFIRDRGMEDRTTVISFGPRSLKRFHRIAPDVKIGLDFDTPGFDWLFRMFPRLAVPVIKTLSPGPLAAYIPGYAQMSDKLPALVHENFPGTKLVPFIDSFNVGRAIEKKRYGEFIPAGVDGLVTDAPDLLVEHIGRKLNAEA